MLVTCCVTHERWKVTCFVTHAVNLTMPCREGDVEANVSLHLHAQFKSCPLLFYVACTLFAFSFVKVCNTLFPKTRVVVFDVLRTIVVYSCLERAPVGGCRCRPKFWRMQIYCCSFSFYLRQSSGFTFDDVCTSSDTSCSCSSVRLPHGGVVGFKDVS